MDNLIFCLNATIPIFLTLMLGYFLRKINLYDDSFVAQMNKFVFKAALPALLFMNVAESDFIKVWDTKFCSLLFWRYVLQHCHFYRSFLPAESKGHTGRICPGLLPQQRGNPRHCYHPEPLWRCRYGTSYDHSKRSSL